MRNRNGSIAHFHISYLEIFTKPDIIIELISYKKSFKKSTSKINRNSNRLIQFYFFTKIRCHIGCTKSKFQNIYVWMSHANKIPGLFEAQAFIHHHCNPGKPGFGNSFRNLTKVKIHLLKY